jgi:hypothetical protein
MKGKNAGKKQARPHTVPLTDGAISILEGLPRFRGGAYAFSTTHGATAVWMGTKPKERLERRMLRSCARWQGFGVKIIARSSCRIL